MCDTFVATPECTESKNMIFGKNSDREPNEAHHLVRFAGKKIKERKQKVTYIEIPAPKETYEVILGKPFQMFGAEMGANEFGVVIGNEAVFTKVKTEKKNRGLTGMDMIRIALERTKSSEAALELIIGLLEEFGQDACGGYTDKSFYYHNSFIIADAEKAFVLETAGKEWAAIRVKGFRSISNGLTIESEYDFSSRGLIDYAIKNNFMKKKDEFNFRKVYSDSFFTPLSKCAMRQAITMKKGREFKTKLKAEGAMNILKSHNIHDQSFHPAKSDMSSICMHATGLLTPSQTTGSMVAELRKKGASTFWFTGTSAPCISIFKPFFIPGKTLLEGNNLAPRETPNASMWWKHELLHRKVLLNYQESVSVFQKEKDAFQKEILAQEKSVLKKNSKVILDKFSATTLKKSEMYIDGWLKKIQSVKKENFLKHPIYYFHRKNWDRQSKVKL